MESEPVSAARRGRGRRAPRPDTDGPGLLRRLPRGDHPAHARHRRRNPARERGPCLRPERGRNAHAVAQGDWYVLPQPPSAGRRRRRRRRVQLLADCRSLSAGAAGARASSKVLEPGPLRGRLEARFDLAVFSGLSPDRRRRGDAETLLPVRLILSIEADTPRIDVELEVTNRATDHRLRVHCPLPFPATTSASDTPYHVTRRPEIAARRHPGAPEVELPTYPVWSFVDISDGNIGVALISDGLHEYA